MRFNNLDKKGASDEELTEALKFEIKEKDIIKFVEQQVNRIINKYDK